MTAPQRTVAVFSHPTRPEALAAASAFVSRMHDHGIGCLVTPDLLPVIDERVPQAQASPTTRGQADGAELVVVFGGDGSILRAAEWAYPLQLPLLGVNLGHVGFLAEMELSQMPSLVDHVVHRRYQVEQRLTLAVTVTKPDESVVFESFAINEVAVEKTARERMLELLAILDHRPLSQWSCDGLLVSTPTGSTAYAFSAGGPVMWPDVEAIEVVPLSAHALFARPLVISPNSVVELDMIATRRVTAVITCDGRRSADVQPGDRITVVRAAHDLMLARLSEQPFTTRLVKKFALPVEGWRAVTP